ncbi:DUF2029 domain-containing protein [Humibacter sp. BT305]|nr:DUF2029 domain-containing protein [Humibacter sp. BT305]
MFVVLSVIRRLGANPVLLWVVFLGVHVWLGWDGLTHPSMPFGDVTNVYRGWVEQWLSGDRLGIDGPWVYPLLAIVPMLASLVLGVDDYGIGWMIVVTLADAVVFAYLVGRIRPGGAGRVARLAAAWWWLVFLLLLGPVAVGRIDIFTVDLVIGGLLVVASRPALAGVLLALATWVKVWPAAVLVGVAIAVRRRMRVLVAAGITLVAVLAVALLLGSGMNAFSFVTEQTGRGLQIEAPFASVWLWLAYAGQGQVYYSTEILTFQVTGPGSDLIATLTTPLLVVATAVVLVLAVVVVRRGGSPTAVLPPLALAIIAALMVFNKVGSPQFVVWLSAPVILGLVTLGRRFLVPALLVLVQALLTQVIYPIGYDEILGLDPLMLTVLTVRNLLTVVLFGYALVLLWQSRRARGDRHSGGVDHVVGETSRPVA